MGNWPSETHQPPSTFRTTPVTNREAGSQRKRAASAQSSGVPGPPADRLLGREVGADRRVVDGPGGHRRVDQSRGDQVEPDPVPGVAGRGAGSSPGPPPCWRRRRWCRRSRVPATSQAPSPCSRPCPAGRARRAAARACAGPPRGWSGTGSARWHQERCPSPRRVHSCSAPSPNRRPLIPATWKRMSSRPEKKARACSKSPSTWLDQTHRRPAPERVPPTLLEDARASAAVFCERPQTTTTCAFHEEPSRGRQADAAGPSHDQAGAALKSPGLSHGKEPREGLCSADLGAAKNQSLTWKIASISTAMPPGKAPMPTALRVPMPASPKTSFMRSE